MDPSKSCVINPFLGNPWPLTIIFIGSRQGQHHLISRKSIIQFKLVSHGYAIGPRQCQTQMVGRVYNTYHLLLTPLPIYTPVTFPFLFCPHIGDIHFTKLPDFLALHKVEKYLSYVTVYHVSAPFQLLKG